MTNMQDLQQLWTDEYYIHSYDIDAKGQASLPVLCKFMQESAWKHAENLKAGFSHLAEQNLVWV